jgi:hypothetical protein
MTKFLHWRKMTWALGLWSVYIATWTALTGTGPAMVALWWLAGTALLGMLWLATQPLFQKGRGLSGFFVWPGWTDWRVVDLHRTHRARDPRRDVRTRQVVSVDPDVVLSAGPAEPLHS